MSFVERYKGDLFGGFTAAVVALPLALAFGVSSGAGALAGLYGAIFVGFCAALFGGTPVQVSGPTGPMTVVMALIVLHYTENPVLAFSVVVLAGMFQVSFGIAGIGRYIKLVPQPVVSGFMSGIGVIIIILQLAPVLGHESPGGTILIKLTALPNMMSDLNISALVLAVLSLAIMLSTPQRVARYIPAPLLAIVIGTMAGMFLLPSAPTIGAIPMGLPQFYMPEFTLVNIPYMIQLALVLAFLGSIDSLLTSLVADSMTRTHHDSNRELIGQGIGNVVAGLFGGIPGAGATMRTMINIRAGGTSRLSGVLHAIVLLALVLGFGGAASHIPLAVLAGILIKVGIDIVDWHYLRRIHVAPRAGVVIMMTTLLTTVFVDLMTAVAVGIVMASLLFVSRMADAQMESAKLAFSADHVPDLTTEEAAILNDADGQIVLFHMEGPLSFGSARDVSRLMQSSVERDVLVVDLTDVPFIDSSASIALEEVILALQEHGDTLILFGARPRVSDTLNKIGVLDLLGSDRIAASRVDALRKAEVYIKVGNGPADPL
jgi:SulP family sulfate permease